MDASAVMTRCVVTVSPDTSVPEVVRIMVERQISAVPVLDGDSLVGIVSEGDLLRRAEIGTEHRRSRWIELAFSNSTLAADYAKEHGRRVSDVMTQNVITADSATPIAEIAKLMETHHIKRVPVVENGKLVGIVSRANLVEALARSGKNLAFPGALNDLEIRAVLCKELRRQRWAFTPTEANVVVRNGVVHLRGYIGSEEARRAIVVLAENIPGVQSVQDDMDYPPVMHPF